MNSILDITVSCFKNYDTPANPKEVNLLAWLQSEKYKDTVCRIRSIEDKKKRDELKATLPAITVSGVFSYRAGKDMIKHSGAIAIDIDFKENKHIGNFAELKIHLCNIRNVAYCGLSVSGRGYYCIILIADPDKHKLHFKALQKIFKSYGITIDPACIDVCRLRGYSYDPEGYFNHNATLFAGIYKEPVKKNQFLKRDFKIGNYSQDKISVAVKMIREALDGEKHITLLKAATLMGGYIAAGRVDEDTAINKMGIAIQSRDIDSIEAAKETIRKGIAHGKEKPISSTHSFGVGLYMPQPATKPHSQERVFEEDPFIIEQNLFRVGEVHTLEEAPKPESWEGDITELEYYFETANLPASPVKLNICQTITDITKFINGHLATVKAQNGKRTFLPYLHRLQELKQYLKT